MSKADRTVFCLRIYAIESYYLSLLIDKSLSISYAYEGSWETFNFTFQCLFFFKKQGDDYNVYLLVMCVYVCVCVFNCCL